jgi:excisionase family DNA binding protein
MPKPLESVGYAATRLGITKARAYELIRQGMLRGAVKLGRSIRIDPDALEEFIKNGGQGLPGGWRMEADK